MAVQQPPWSYATLREVAAVLADTEDGLTGREIGDLLGRLGMLDPIPSATKRDRLTEAFVARQNQDGNPRRIITFIVRTMEPVRYRDRPDLFTLRQDRLSERLAFVGLHLNDKGQQRGAVFEAHRGARRFGAVRALRCRCGWVQTCRVRRGRPRCPLWCS